MIVLGPLAQECRPLVDGPDIICQLTCRTTLHGFEDRSKIATVTYLDILNPTSFDRVKSPVLQHSGTIWRNGNSGAIFVLELGALKDLEDGNE